MIYQNGIQLILLVWKTCLDNCKKLLDLSDISKWNTKNLIDIENLFYGCSSLQYLPDISKWCINKVNYIKYLFYNCSSLKSLPNISTWDLSNITKINSMFEECSTLKKFFNDEHPESIQLMSVILILKNFLNDIELIH